MTTTSEPSPDTVTNDPPPHCQGTLTCTEGCCPPMPCPRPAVARVSFGCTGPGCGRATHVELLCAVCADHAERTVVPAPSRRPLR